MPDVPEWVGLVLSAAGGGVLVQFSRVILDAFRGAKADEREQIEQTRREKADANSGFAALADDLQESLKQEREYSNAQRSRLDAIQEELDAALDLNRHNARRAAGWREYALILRQDITDGRPPPPRDIPDHL